MDLTSKIPFKKESKKIVSINAVTFELYNIFIHNNGLTADQQRSPVRFLLLWPHYCLLSHRFHTNLSGMLQLVRET